MRPRLQSSCPFCGEQNRHYRDQQIQAIVGLRVQGKTYREIAAGFLMSRQGVQAIVKKEIRLAQQRQNIFSAHLDTLPGQVSPMAEWPIQDLPLSTRAKNCLTMPRGRFKIPKPPYRTLQSVAATSDDELLELQHMGRRTLREIRTLQDTIGLSTTLPSP